MSGLFDSVVVGRQQAANMEALRKGCYALWEVFRAAMGADDRAMPLEAEQAMVSLQEFGMWANKAISRKGMH